MGRQLSREQVATLRVLQGRRVRLVRCTDPYTTLAPGTLGTVHLVDDWGTVHVSWDDGSRLGLVPGLDAWELVS